MRFVLLLLSLSLPPPLPISLSHSPPRVSLTLSSARPICSNFQLMFTSILNNAPFATSNGTGLCYIKNQASRTSPMKSGFSPTSNVSRASLRNSLNVWSKFPTGMLSNVSPDWSLRMTVTVHITPQRGSPCVFYY